VVNKHRDPSISRRPWSRYRWELSGVALAILVVTIALAVLITSRNNQPSATENHRPPSETVTIAPPPSQTFTVDVDKGTKDAHTVNVPIPTVSVAIPDAVFDKLGPPSDTTLKWLVDPLATVLAAVGAAGAAILAARFALRGVLKQAEATLKEAEDKSFSDRRDDVWERFTWVVDSDRGKLLDWKQRTSILEALRTKASNLDDSELSGIIDQWLSDRVRAIYLALLESEDPKAAHTSLSQLLMIDPADAIAVAQLAVADKSLSKDIRKQAQAILDRSDQLENVLATNGDPPPEPPPIGARRAALAVSGADHELAYYSAPPRRLIKKG
jgi:hypothetical protein